MTKKLDGKLGQTYDERTMLFQAGASLCCGYGSTGLKNSKGYDCLLLPGARKADDSNALVSSRSILIFWIIALAFPLVNFVKLFDAKFVRVKLCSKLLDPF